uniref:Uncharacterized protein n=1 Tax=Anopheles atroparvus TaxID=41427 RepID=A0AAG5D2H6_ANOAO
ADPAARRTDLEAGGRDRAHLLPDTLVGECAILEQLYHRVGTVSSADLVLGDRFSTVHLRAGTARFNVAFSPATETPIRPRHHCRHSGSS